MEQELEKLLPDGYYLADGIIFDKYDFVVGGYIKDAESAVNPISQAGLRGYLSPPGAKFTNALGENKSKFFEIIERFGDTPNYPFKDDWYAMSLKQLLKDAIDEGADAISVSSSAPIKARYTDEYSKFYETLYDQKIPSAMKKLANKYGGKFEKGSLNLEDISKGDIRYPTDNPLVLKETKKMAESNIIRITPEMKQKILEEGFSNFAIGGAVLKPFSIDNIDIFNS